MVVGYKVHNEDLNLEENFSREQPSHFALFQKFHDKLHSMLATDFADQVDSIPVISSLLTQVHNTSQKGFGSPLTVLCCLAFWLIEKTKKKHDGKFFPYQSVSVYGLCFKLPICC